MSKPNILKVTQLTAVLFSFTKLALDIFFILNNYYSVHTALFGGKHQQDVLPMDIKMWLIIEAIIISVPIGIVAAVNYTKTDMKQKRGIITVATSGLMFFADYLASAILHHTVILSLSKKYAENVISMISSINSVRSLTSILSCTALVMLCCCGAVEIYGGAKLSSNPA